MDDDGEKRDDAIYARVAEYCSRIEAREDWSTWIDKRSKMMIEDV